MRMRWQYFVLVGLLAFVLRFGFIATLDPADTVLSDGDEYDFYGKSILAGEGYPREPKLWPFVRPPVYPYFLAGAYALFGAGNFTAVRGVQAGLDSGTVVLVAVMAGTLAGARAAIMAGLGAAAYPHLIHQASAIGTECIFTFLVALVTWRLLCAVGEPLRLGGSLTIGAILMLAVLSRPAVGLFVAGALLWLVAATDGSIRQRVWAAAGAGSVVLVALLGWGTANWYRGGEWYLFDGSGFVFWVGHNKTYQRLFEVKDRDSYESLNRELMRSVNSERVGTQGMTVAEKNAYFVRLGLDYIRSDPAAALLLEAKKLWHLWRPWVNPLVYDSRVLLVTGVAFALVEFLGGLGLALLWRGGRRAEILLFLLLMVSATIVGVGFLATTRYRVPMADPYLIVTASVAVIRGWERFRNSGRPSLSETD